VSVVMFYLARHSITLFPEDPAPVLFVWYWQPPNTTSVSLGMYRAGLREGSTVDSQVVKSCLSVAIVPRGRMGMDHSRVLVLFRLVAPLLQLGMVEPYLIWGAWFPSHVPLEETGCIQIFGS
jgi:hypothetical protein